MDKNDMKTAQYSKFYKGYDKGRNQLVYRWIAGDLDTPVSAYMKLCDNEDYSFLLESVEGGAVLGRYSVIGLRPDLFWRYPGDSMPETALADLKKLSVECRIDDLPDSLPPMASSGLFGYFGYDMVRLVEDIPATNPDTLNIPDSVLFRPTIMVIFDHVRQMICLTAPVYHDAAITADQAWEGAQMRLEETERILNAPQKTAKATSQLSSDMFAPESNISRQEFEQIVTRAVDYIKAGDVFQVVPSQRFTIPFDLSSLALYRSLRRLNPSPFLFHVRLGDFSLVGSSPEILVRVRDGNVTIRPIAGTRPRGKTAQEDNALAAELLADPKECAEHLMLLDLARNDVGRVAEIGSVNVTDRFLIERYSHVMHIVSNVEGRLRQDLHPLDALFAGFPAGTVSGAPKIRAMEIIDELEPVRRSFYGGCIGYLSGNGDIDSCITLRTAIVKDGQMHVQAGAGIVADSVPELEYQETVNKARALIAAARDALSLG